MCEWCLCSRDEVQITRLGNFVAAAGVVDPRRVLGTVAVAVAEGRLFFGGTNNTNNEQQQQRNERIKRNQRNCSLFYYNGVVLIDMRGFLCGKLS